ncbi:MAG: nitroreductase [Candidatus Omnitrophota bacterium]|jgi:nitroreductase
MSILRLIKTRRSIRKFKKKTIAKRLIDGILEAGRWAPSGLNNQPWKFLVLDKAKKDSLAEFTHYSSVIKEADKAILVFLDKKASYNREKDLMAIGACIQNMLLYGHSKKIGACWLGEIINQKDKLQRFLKIPKYLELMAVLALGYPSVFPKRTKRKQLRSLIEKR